MSPPLFIRTPNDNNTLATLPTFNNNEDNTSTSSHTRLQIGIIIALIIAGLAILACTATCIVKRRRRAAKKAAKAVKLGPLRDGGGYGYGYEWDDVVILGDGKLEEGDKEAEGEGQGGARENGEGERPPRYSVVVAGADGKGEGKVGHTEGV